MQTSDFCKLQKNKNKEKTYQKFLHFWHTLSQGTTYFWSPLPIDKWSYISQTFGLLYHIL